MPDVLFDNKLPAPWAYDGRVATNLELAKRLTRASVKTAWYPPLQGGRFVPGTVHVCLIEPTHRRLREGELLVGAHASHACSLPNWLTRLNAIVQIDGNAYVVARRVRYRGGGRDQMRPTRYILQLQENN